MKRSIIFTLLAINVLISCDSPDKKVATSGDDKTYDLRMRLAKSDNFGYDMVTEMSMDFMNMKMIASVAADIVVVDSTAQGKQLKVSYTKMKTTTESAILGNQFDSIANKTNKDLIGTSAIATLEGNKVIAVAPMQNSSGTITDAKNKEVIEKMYSKESLNNFFGMLFNMYPAQAVKVGESWSTDNRMDIGGVLTKVSAAYTLLNVSNGIAEVGMEAQMNSDGNMENKGKQIDVDVKGTQKGIFFINVNSGYLRDGSFEGDVDATINMAGQKMPIKGKVKAKIKGKG